MASDILDLGKWCILRMASLDTLPVKEALEKMGFEVWTPIERKAGRRPRTRKEYDKTLAITPSYVFAPADRLDDLLAMSVNPLSDCPRFTVFRHGDGFPLIADVELEALRHQERVRNEHYDKQQARKRKSPSFAPGLEVPLTAPGFEGLSGTVRESKGGQTWIDVPGFPMPIKIASLLLQSDVLANEAENCGARAA